MNNQLTPEQLNYLVSLLRSNDPSQGMVGQQMAGMFGQGRPMPAPGTETSTVGMRG